MPPVNSKRKFFLAATRAMAVFVGVRRDNDFGENLDDLGGGFCIERAV